jgi:galactose mutarotase-like enzyme
MVQLPTIPLAAGEDENDTRVVLAPARGGIATQMSVGGRPLLYMDEGTLLDTTKNVRGGIPVLFPSPGPLEKERFTRNGRSGSMNQHGFARQRPWMVLASSAHEATLTLASDASTRAEFPWDFLVTLRYEVGPRSLVIEQLVENQSDEAMPFAFGFHPYFAVPNRDKEKATIPTLAKRAWDNVTKREIDLEAPIDLTAREVDLHLVDHRASEATLDLGDGSRIVVSGTSAYRRWVIWTLAGKDFVCLEPWTAPANALNTGDDLLLVEPGKTVDLSVRIALL